MYTEKFNENFVRSSYESGHPDYIIVGNDLSVYGLDFVSCLEKFDIFKSFCDFFKLSYVELSSLLLSYGYKMRDLFKFVYSTFELNDLDGYIFIDKGFYEYRHYDKKSRSFLIEPIYIYLKCGDFIYGDFLLYLFKYRYGMIYDNFVHSEKRFPFYIPVERGMRLDDLLFNVEIKSIPKGYTSFKLKVGDLVDIVEKGDSVFDEEKLVSDFRFFTMRDMSDQFYLYLDRFNSYGDAESLYIPFEFLVEGDWGLVENLKRYIGSDCYRQGDMDLFNDEKVLRFKKVCEEFFGKKY